MRRFAIGLSFEADWTDPSRRTDADLAERASAEPEQGHLRAPVVEREPELVAAHLALRRLPAVLVQPAAECEAAVRRHRQLDLVLWHAAVAVVLHRNRRPVENAEPVVPAEAELDRHGASGLDHVDRRRVVDGCAE